MWLYLNLNLQIHIFRDTQYISYWTIFCCGQMMLEISYLGDECTQKAPQSHSYEWECSLSPEFLSGV